MLYDLLEEEVLGVLGSEADNTVLVFCVAATGGRGSISSAEGQGCNCGGKKKSTGVGGAKAARPGVVPKHSPGHCDDVSTSALHKSYSFENVVNQHC